MTATHVKILDKEAVSNMSHFGAFHRMFVHFHFYITHEAACESLHYLDFCSRYLMTCCNVWTLYTTIFSSISKIIYCFNIHITIHVLSSFYCTKIGISHIFI